uniref:Receptor-type protein tyrosine kinase n=1 Tax=Monosiga ovata TaxID=81526 RepID=B3XVV7_9EUKA|nr:receptor-type protein tyrosine kinase [Monosiga ovata]
MVRKRVMFALLAAGLCALAHARVPEVTACLRTAGNVPAVIPSCDDGKVWTSILLAGYGNSSITSTSTCAYSQGACQSPGAYAAMATLCLNKQRCSIQKSAAVLGDSGCSSASPQIAFVGICGYGGPYYSTPTSGCSPANFQDASPCCNLSTTCSSGYLQRGICVSSCSSDFSANNVTKSNTTVCLSPLCLLASPSDCSKCAQCATGYGVALDGSCQLAPSLSVSSPQYPNVSLCDGATINATTLPNLAYSPPITWSPTAVALSTFPNGSTATLTSSACTTSAIYSHFVPANSYYLGAVYVNCTATDSNKISSTCLFSLQVYSTQLPNITCPTSQTIASTAMANYSEVSISSIESQIAVWDSIDDTPPTPHCIFNFTETADPNIQRAPLNANGVPAQSNITCYVTNTNQLTAYCKFSLTVYDNEAPVLYDCPENGSGPPLVGGMGDYNWTAPTAVDNVNGPVDVTCNATNASFPIGITIVGCAATDAAGNTGRCYFAVNITDDSPPEVYCPANKTIFSPSSSTNVSWETPTTYDLAAISRTQISYVPTIGGPSTSVCSGNGICNLNSAIVHASGLLQFTFTAINAASLTNSCSWYVEIFASLAVPNCTNASRALNATADAGVSTAFVTMSATCAPGANCLPTLTANQRETIFITSEALTCAFGSSPASNCSFPTTFPLGTSIVEYSASDSYGFSTACYEYVVVLDKESPVFPACANITINTTLNQAVGYVPCPAMLPTDNAAIASVVTSPATLSGVLCDTSLAIGRYNFSYLATDTSGNTAVCNVTTVVQDKQPPTFTQCPTTISKAVNINSNTTTVTWTVSATDNSGAVSLVYNPSVTSGDVFDFGTYAITVTATDSNMNSAVCAFTIRVIDSQAPTIIGCPSNQTYTAYLDNSTVPGRNYGTYTLPALDATDNVQLVTKTFVSVLDHYPVGQTLVSFQAYDSSGNPAFCSMYVRISDIEPPTIFGCLENVTFSCPTLLGRSIGPCSWSALSAVDAVSSVTSLYTSTPAGYTQGSNFPFGTTTLAYQAYDASSNMATCSFFIKITDPEPPTLHCPASFTTYTESTAVDTATVSWTTPIVTDNVLVAGGVNYSLSPGVLQIGLYNITATAFDTSGNMGSCNFSVTILRKVDLTQVSDASSNASTVGFAAGIGGAGLLLILLIVALVVFRRRQKKKLAIATAGWADFLNMSDEFILERAKQIQITMMAQKQVILPSFDAHNVRPQREFQPPPSTYPELVQFLSKSLGKELARSQIILGMEIGRGEFGHVYEGTFKTEKRDTKVAVKQLHSNTNENNRMRFLKEAAIMAQFDHSNIVNLVGICLLPESAPVLIVLEYMHLGSLHGYLQSPMVRNQLETLSLLRMAIDVCAGLVYLSDAGFVHRDLAARNILIDKEMTCRIGDFGLSIDLAALDGGQEGAGIYSATEGKTLPIPVRWTALEAILYRQFSTASDVWSFGVVMWELWSYAELPYKSWSNKKVTQMVTEGYRLPNPIKCPFDVYKLMIECWSMNPRFRPPFSRLSVSLIEIWKDIHASQESGQSYLHGAMQRPSMGLYDHRPSFAPSEGPVMEGPLQETAFSENFRVTANNTLYNIGDNELDTEADSASAIDSRLSAATESMTGSSGPQTARERFKAQAKRRESIGLSTVRINITNINKPVQVEALGTGILKFVGPHHMTGEIVCGIAMDASMPDGSDGRFEGKRYFLCEGAHGILVPEAQVTPIYEKGQFVYNAQVAPLAAVGPRQSVFGFDAISLGPSSRKPSGASRKPSLLLEEPPGMTDTDGDAAQQYHDAVIIDLDSVAARNRPVAPASAGPAAGAPRTGYLQISHID